MGMGGSCCGHRRLLQWAWAALAVGMGGSCNGHGRLLTGSGGSPLVGAKRRKKKKKHFMITLTSF